MTTLDTRIALLEQGQKQQDETLERIERHFTEFRLDIKELLELKQKWKAGAVFIFTLGAFAAWFIENTQAMGRWFSRLV